MVEDTIPIQRQHRAFHRRGVGEVLVERLQLREALVPVRDRATEVVLHVHAQQPVAPLVQRPSGAEAKVVEAEEAVLRLADDAGLDLSLSGVPRGPQSEGPLTC